MLAQDVGLDSRLAERFGGPPSHAVAEHGATVAERLHDGGVARAVMIVLSFAVALATGVGGKCVAPELFADDLSVLDIENQEV